MRPLIVNDDDGKALFVELAQVRRHPAIAVHDIARERGGVRINRDETIDELCVNDAPDDLAALALAAMAVEHELMRRLLDHIGDTAQNG